MEPVSPPEGIRPSVVTQLADDQVTITIPETSADVWHTEPVPGIEKVKNSGPVTGPNVWNDDPVLQPLGVGEGWADAVLTQPKDPKSSIFDKQASGSQILTPSDAINIAPLELRAPTPSNALDATSVPSIPTVIVAQEQSTQTLPDPILMHVSSTSQPASNSSISAPPGLSKRANSRKGQEAAVVMPGSGTPSVDRIGLKFGSLSLFDEASAPEVNEEPSAETPSPPATAEKTVPAETG